MLHVIKAKPMRTVSQDLDNALIHLANESRRKTVAL